MAFNAKASYKKEGIKSACFDSGTSRQGVTTRATDHTGDYDRAERNNFGSTGLLPESEVRVQMVNRELNKYLNSRLKKNLNKNFIVQVKGQKLVPTPA